MERKKELPDVPERDKFKAVGARNQDEYLQILRNMVDGIGDHSIGKCSPDVREVIEEDLNVVTYGE